MGPVPFLRLDRCFEFDPQGESSLMPRSLLGEGCSACTTRDGPQPHITAITCSSSDYRPRDLSGKEERSDRARGDGGARSNHSGLDLSYT